ncbi:MAG: RNA-binding protein [Rhodospirillales bacterium]|nr:MAG: RNA-binding protein [Rhodospirillales bacterium]
MNKTAKLGPVGVRAEPLRRCIAGGGVRPTAGMVRFVVDSDGLIVPDVDGRLPGRGFWLSADRELLKKACSRNLFARAARAPVRTPPDLVERTERLLARRCINLVALARRARQAVQGFDKVRDWLKAGRAGLVLCATDAGAAGRAKIRAHSRDLPVVAVLTADELGAASGRDHAVHVAVAPGRLADGICREAKRLSGFRARDPEADTVGRSKGTEPQQSAQQFD